MKKSRIIALIIFLALALALLAACSGGKKITVTFEVNGGEELDSIVVKSGEALSLPDAVRPYYIFEGWYDITLTEHFTSSTAPAESLTLYAKWRAGASARILFETNGGSAVSEIVAECGVAVTAPESPVMEGYLFAGWYAEKNLATAYQFNIMPDNDVTVYAKWERNPALAMVNFYGNGTLLKTLFAEKGKGFSLVGIAPEFSGDYTFGAWSETGGTAYTERTLTADLNLYGDYYSKGLEIVSNTVVNYSGEGKNVVLPSSVTAIADNAFSYNKTIKSIVFGENVTDIGDSAFINCSALIEVTGAENVISVGEFAFLNCTSLTRINLKNATSIGSSAFNNCTVLSDISLGNALSEIGDFAFANCRALRFDGIKFGNALERIGDYAFYQCESLLAFYFPANLMTLGKGALQGCMSIKNITVDRLNENFVTMDNNVYNKEKTTLLFYQQSGKTESVFTIPDGVVTVESNAFIGNLNLQHIIIPASVQNARGILSSFERLSEITLANFDKIGFIAYLYGAADGQANGKSSIAVPSVLKKVNLTSAIAIPDYAFYGCLYLNEINGIANVTSVGESAFAYTTLYSTFHIEKALSHIGEGAFEGCNVTFTVDTQNSHFVLTEKYLYNNTEKALVKVMPSVSVFDFTAEGIDDCESVYSFAFEGCSDISVLEIPSTVSHIGVKAFQDCSGIRTMRLPVEGILSNVVTFDMLFGGVIPEIANVEVVGKPTEIPAFAFSFSRVTNIKLPTTVNTIGIAAFSDCSLLESITGLDNVTTVKQEAFYRCTLLTSITFQSLVVLEYAVFCYSGLVSFTIPSSLEILGAQSFLYCENLTDLTYEDIGSSKLAGFGDWSFLSSGLTGKLVIPASVTYIGDNAFSQSKITEVEFVGTPTDELEIESWAFSSCRLLSKVTFLDNLTKLGQFAFAYCIQLESVTLRNGLKVIDSFAFTGCTLLEDIELPTTLTLVGQDILRGTAWIATQGIGIIYNGNAAVAYRGDFSDTEIDLAFAPTAHDKSINVICTWVLESLIYNSEGEMAGGYYQYKIGTLTIPEGYTHISRTAFARLNKKANSSEESYIKNVYLPSSLIYIGDGAFNANQLLATVTIGTADTVGSNALEEIGDNAFSDCPILIGVYLYKTAATASDLPILKRDTDGKPTLFERINQIAPMQVTLFVPESSLSVYRAAWRPESDPLGSYFPMLGIAGI